AGVGGGGGALGEGVGEGGRGVGEAGVAGGIDRAPPPVVSVVLEHGRRRERRCDRRRVAADLRADREVGGGVDLHLVARRARDRIPRELWVVCLVGCVQVVDVQRRRRRPRPGEGSNRGRGATVALRVNRNHAPVVGAGGQRGRDRERVRLYLRNPGRVVGRVERERAQIRVGCHRDQVVRGTGHRGPAELERVGAE